MLLALALLSIGGPLEASGGARVVRAAVRLQAVVGARVEEPLRASLVGAAGQLVTDLRAAAAAEDDARQAAYVAALERVRLLDAVVVYAVPQPARRKVMRAAGALERALLRATGTRPRRR
jgi:hypothetical protein